MKKKIFSALLMGVFTLASMSMFVSCKDYDDDINGLDTQQQELLSRLEALEGNVDTNLSTLKDQLATATENANKALTGVQGLEGTVNEVSSTAQAAGNAATAAQGAAQEAKDAADKAQATADEALEAAKKALEAAGVDDEGNTLLEQVADLSNRVGKLEGMVDVLTPLMEQVEKAMTEDLPALKEKVDLYEAYFDNLFAMVTSVELYGTFSGNGFITGEGAADKALQLAMIHGNVGADSHFGDNEALQNDNKTVFATATPEQVFAKGTDIKVNEGVVVRVNPVNAKLTKDNCDIKVINSLGQDMSDFIQVADIEPYQDIITRGGQINSGLYKVYFEWVDGLNVAAYKNSISVVDENGRLHPILFAIAINNTNTEEEKTDRYVASTFDLALGYTPYEPASYLSFYVDNTPVSGIRNRWNGSATTGDADETLVGEATNAKENMWTKNKDNEIVPATAMIPFGSSNANVEYDSYDKRSDKPYYPAVVGTPFTISLSTIEKDVPNALYNNAANTIQYYYVTLDENFAGVSAPSELNSWKSYDISGLYTVTDADKSLKITINSLEANADKGDKIGFRVFAVNYDGTLVDPDGRAFYVAVGNESTVGTVNAEVKAWEGSSVTVDLPSDFKPASCENAVDNDVLRAIFDNAGVKTTAGAKIHYTILDKDGKTVSDWKDAKKIKIELVNLNNFLDGETFSFTIVAKDGTGTETTDRVINTLNVNVKKVMPTEANLDVTFKQSQLVDGKFVIYFDTNPWNALSTTGSKNIWNAVTGIYKDVNYVWTFANTNKDGDGKYTKNKAVTTTTPEVYNFDVDADLIDGSTEHAMTLERNFKNISCQINKQGVPEAVEDFKVLALSATAVYACPIDLTTYAWNQAPTGKKDDKGNDIMADCNWINYKAKYPAWFTTNDGANGGLTGYIKATNSIDQDDYTIKGVWSKDLYVVDADKNIAITAKLISNDTKKEDYFTVEVTSYGNLIFHQISETRNPVADVPSTLIITATDAFGHKRDVASLPFTVKRIEE